MHLVKLLKLNKVTIPKEIREKLGLKVGDYLSIEAQEGRIILKKVEIK